MRATCSRAVVILCIHCSAASGAGFSQKSLRAAVNGQVAQGHPNYHTPLVRLHVSLASAVQDNSQTARELLALDCSKRLPTLGSSEDCTIYTMKTSVQAGNYQRQAISNPKAAVMHCSQVLVKHSEGINPSLWNTSEYSSQSRAAVCPAAVPLLSWQSMVALMCFASLRRYAASRALYMLDTRCCGTVSCDYSSIRDLQLL